MNISCAIPALPSMVREQWKASVRVSDLLADIRTRDLLNTKYYNVTLFPMANNLGNEMQLIMLHTYIMAPVW